jgi:hypothetical protein
VHIRNLKLWSAALLAGVAALTLPATQVSASATGCVNGSPSSCVRVIGASTYVNSVGGGVVLGARQSVRGHFETYSFEARFRFNSLNQTYWNQSWWHYSTFWGPLFTINHPVPDGSKICSVFWEWKGGGYVWHSPACETVHR